MTDEVDDFLAHFGVKGMKWGKRKQAVLAADAKILEARSNQKARKARVSKSISELDKFDVSKGPWSKAEKRAQKKAEQEYFDSINDIRMTPDKKTAALKTSGEKAVDRVIMAVGAVTVVSLIAAGVAYDDSKSK